MHHHPRVLRFGTCTKKEKSKKNIKRKYQSGALAVPSLPSLKGARGPQVNCYSGRQVNCYPVIGWEKSCGPRQSRPSQKSTRSLHIAEHQKEKHFDAMPCSNLQQFLLFMSETMFQSEGWSVTFAFPFHHPADLLPASSREMMISASQLHFHVLQKKMCTFQENTSSSCPPDDYCKCATIFK